MFAETLDVPHNRRWCISQCDVTVKSVRVCDQVEMLNENLRAIYETKNFNQYKNLQKCSLVLKDYVDFNFKLQVYKSKH